MANRGVARNKRPLQNILYKFEPYVDRFVMLWSHERDFNRDGTWNHHGTVTEDDIKSRLTPNQWSKFRQGVRQFVKQRRVDGRNIPVTK